MAAFLETLTATHDANFFHVEAARLGNPLRTGIRGSPLNQGSDLQTVHPVIRTNRKSASTVIYIAVLTATAVTGWKSVFVNKGFTKRINGVTKDESDVLLPYLFNVIHPILLLYIAFLPLTILLFLDLDKTNVSLSARDAKP